MSNGIRLTVFISVYIDFILPALKSIYVPTDTTDAFGHKMMRGNSFCAPCKGCYPRLASKSPAKISKLSTLEPPYSLSSFSVTPFTCALSFQPNRIICSSLTISYLFLNCKPLSLPLLEHLPSIKFDFLAELLIFKLCSKLM